MNPTDRKFTIGRSKSSDLVLADESVSRRHAEITLLADGSIRLADCRSSRGTAVVRNGRATRIEREIVKPADVVRFGDLELSVAEILDALRVKEVAVRPAAEPVAAPARDRAEAERAGKAAERPGKLVRCGCGAVKPRQGACPECGQ